MYNSFSDLTGIFLTKCKSLRFKTWKTIFQLGKKHEYLLWKQAF